MFKLSIVSPERVLYEREVNGIIVPGTDGYLGVLSHHAPLITSLKPGKITITESENKQLAAAVSGGFLEVSDNIATILADSVELLEEIDVERARSAYQRAKQRIGLKSTDVDVERAQESLRRAENRLRILGEKLPT
jgi:F-type H+-transporting ATPase subunit epsilon